MRPEGRRSAAVSPARRLLVAALGAALAAGSCLSPAAPQPPAHAALPSVPPSPIGDWAFHISGGTYADEVEFAEVDTVVSSAAAWQLRSLSTRSWSDSVVPPIASDIGVASRAATGSIVWDFATADGTPARMTWDVEGDTIRGRFVFDSSLSDTGYALVGIRASDSIRPLGPLNGPPGGTASQVPMVLIRLDDLPATDTGVVARMIERGLYGELAIPTARVGDPTRATWEDVAEWVGGGFGVAAHSRYHEPLMSDAQFMGEVLGSLADLARRGYSTRDFVQPGVWQGVTDFDSIAKIRTWRGAFFQTFTRVFEGYEWRMPSAMPLADSIAMGITHWTISDGAAPVAILSWWRSAQQPRMFSVFLIHTANLANPDTLDWFLDSVAVAVRSGRVRLARTATDALTP